MRKIDAVVALIALLTGWMVSPAEALSITKGPFFFVNDTGGDVNDFHAVFSGTGGSIHDPDLILDPTHGQGSISRGMHRNDIDIVWEAGAVVKHGERIGFVFKVAHDVPVTFDHGWWSEDSVRVGDATLIPEPCTLLLVAPGLTGLIILGRRRSALRPLTRPRPSS